MSHFLLQVHVRVQIPQKVSNEEKKLFEELQEMQAKQPVGANKKGKGGKKWPFGK